MRTLQIVFDCTDPSKLARFYAEALCYKLQDPSSGYKSWEAFLESSGIPESEWNSSSAIVDPEGNGPRIYFQQMDTPKLGKSRLHIDINPSGGMRVPLDQRKMIVDREVTRIIALGATKQRELRDNKEYWVVMIDPKENEFCIQ